jgi:hypothetical protein
MSAGKFLRIFDRVSGMILLVPATDARVEYGDENFFPSIYYVRSVTTKGDTTRVLLEPPRATCKARDRRVQTRELESACC